MNSTPVTAPSSSPVSSSTTEERPASNLNACHGLKNWLLTHDHKRIAMLYLMGITLFFAIGGLLAFILRLELLTPASDLYSTFTIARA